MQRPIVTRVCGVVVVCLMAAASVQASYISEVSSDTPLGYWRLGEASGTTAANQVSGGVAGSYVNFSAGDYGKTGALSASGDTNTAAGFDGTNNYVTIAESAVSTVGTGAFTVEMWFNDSNVTARGDLLDYKAGTTDFGFGVENGKWQCLSQQAGKWGVCQTTLSNGTWYHVAITRDASSTLTGYLNGEQAFTITGSPENFGAVGSPIWIGANNSSGSPAVAFNGSIDEVAIYGHALSQADIAAHYSAGITAVPEPASLTLLGASVLGLLAYAWRKQR